MIVQFNTDHNINGSEKLRDRFVAQITDELVHYSARITRVEAHLTDEDGSSKNGQNDKRCVLEARLEGHNPVAVTSHADTYDQAVDSALDKLRSSLEKIVGRLKDHHQ